MPHRHRRLTAWLGILAIFLAIAAPLASQWRASTLADLTAIVCSADHPSTTADAHHAHGLDKCGYCGFFAHLPAIHGATTATAHRTTAFATILVPLSITASPPSRYPRARPRAPPARI